MRILRCTSSIDPALGGLYEAVRQASVGLPKLGHSIEVVCLDNPEASWIRSFPAKVHALGPTKFLIKGFSALPYGISPKFICWMRSHARNYDAIVIDGLWQFPGLGTWLALRGSTVP